MRIGVIAAVLALAGPAAADPSGRVELGGFFGVDYFGNDIALGGSPAPEQRPQTAPMFGGRLTFVPLKLGRPDVHLDLGLEGELSFTPSWTGYGFDGPRPSIFAPVIGYRANLLIRIGGGWMQPHATVGGGGATVAPSSSDMIVQDTDAIFQWGLGASFPFDRWQLRFDGRQGFTRAMGGGITQTYEANVSIVAHLGGKHAAPHAEVLVVTEPPPPPPEPDKDTDADGIPDSLDVCPTQPESVNGIADQDGCPEPDVDKDGLVGASDNCPDQAEDFDKFEDEDGCPDNDNDKDGVPDAKDNCPNEAENKNGIADTDGCVDQIPEAVTKALAGASAVKFETGKARMTKAGKTALDKAFVPLLSNKLLRVTITVAPEKADDAATELAKKRGDIVKWYLIDQGVAEGNISTAVGAVVPNKKTPLVTLSITP